MMPNDEELSPNITAKFRSSVMAATFDGFPTAATKFLKELEEKNNKAWFDDNRADH